MDLHDLSLLSTESVHTSQAGSEKLSRGYAILWATYAFDKFNLAHFEWHLLQYNDILGKRTRKLVFINFTIANWQSKVVGNWEFMCSNRRIYV